MFTIAAVNDGSGNAVNVLCSDGQPLTAPRGGQGQTFSLLLPDLNGRIDVADLNAQAGVYSLSTSFNSVVVGPYGTMSQNYQLVPGQFTVTVSTSSVTVTETTTGKSQSVPLRPLAQVVQFDSGGLFTTNGESEAHLEPNDQATYEMQVVNLSAVELTNVQIQLTGMDGLAADNVFIDPAPDSNGVVTLAVPVIEVDGSATAQFRITTANGTPGNYSFAAQLGGYSVVPQSTESAVSPSIDEGQSFSVVSS